MACACHQFLKYGFRFPMYEPRFLKYGFRFLKYGLSTAWDVLRASKA